MRRTAVHSSPVHGRGVFALTPITAGEVLFEYKGALLSWKEAQRRYKRSAAEDGHTFFFDLGDGRVIDGGHGGNSARWVNHSCAPNCETEQKGSRVYFYALRDINPGEELFIDYRLFVEGRRTRSLKSSINAAAGRVSVEGRCSRRRIIDGGDQRTAEENSALTPCSSYVTMRSRRLYG
jgi:SET domain-containing protein